MARRGKCKAFEGTKAEAYFRTVSILSPSNNAAFSDASPIFLSTASIGLRQNNADIFDASQSHYKNWRGAKIARHFGEAKRRRT